MSALWSHFVVSRKRNKIQLFQVVGCIAVLLLLAACDKESASSGTMETAVEHAKKHLDPLYVCPMHPKVTSDKAGNCPICGMDLVKKETAVEHAMKHLDPLYVCPMHPKVTSDKAGSCPICGMDLVKKERGPATGDYPQVELTPDIVQKMGVRTSVVTKGQLWKFIKTVGYVGFDEDRYSTVTAKTNGWVENLSVRVKGLRVNKGQLLFELYSPEFLTTQKEFIEAQKKDLSGINRGYATRNESIPSRERLRYMGISQSLMNQIARKGKAQYRIPFYAPIQGWVIEHNVSNGQYIYEDDPLLTIADLSTVWVEAHVYEHQLAWLHPGLKAEIEVKALPGKVYKGEVNFIDPVLDEKTRTLKVRLRVPNTDGNLKPNMFANVKIYAGPKKAILNIPREALIVTGERESVILDKGQGKYQPVNVVTGMQSQGRVEILSGLKKGDKIVTSGEFLIDSEANLQASFQRLDSQQ